MKKWVGKGQNVGLLMYMMGVQVDKKVMVSLMVAINVIMYVPEFYKPFGRLGPDTTAYINQAGQFMSGQTNYEQLSSAQGPCYYPAGHLWHYSPFYFLFLSTDIAERILLAFHILLHTLSLVILCLLSYNYFKRTPGSA